MIFKKEEKLIERNKHLKYWLQNYLKAIKTNDSLKINKSSPSLSSQIIAKKSQNTWEYQLRTVLLWFKFVVFKIATEISAIVTTKPEMSALCVGPPW